MTQTPSPTPQATGFGLVALLAALTAFAPLAMDMYLPAFPAMAKDLGSTGGQAQISLSVFMLGMAAGQFLYGPASDRFGRRGPLIFGAVLFASGAMLCAVSTSMEMLLVARFVQAIGGSAGGVVSRAVVRDRFDHTETARTLSLLMLIMGLAPILAPPVGGWIMAASNWRWIFWLQAGFGLIVALVTLLLLAESRSAATAALARSENPFTAVMALLKSPRLIGYALAGALNGAALFTYISSSPELIMGVYGFSSQAFGWLFGINAVAVIGANQLNRWLLRYWTPDQVLARASLVSCLLASLLVTGALTGVGGGLGVLVPLFFTLGSYSLMQGNTSAGALSVDPQRAGSTSALLGTLSFGAGAIGSALGGHLADGTARPMTLLILAAVVGSTLSLHLLALKPDQSAGRN